MARRSFTAVSTTTFSCSQSILISYTFLYRTVYFFQEQPLSASASEQIRTMSFFAVFLLLLFINLVSPVNRLCKHFISRLFTVIWNRKSTLDKEHILNIIRTCRTRAEWVEIKDGKYNPATVRVQRDWELRYSEINLRQQFKRHSKMAYEGRWLLNTAKFTSKLSTWWSQNKDI